MPNEQITLTNMSDRQLAVRLAEANAAIKDLDAGHRLEIKVTHPSSDWWHVRMTDRGAFEIRAAIYTDAIKHRAEIEAEIAERQLAAKAEAKS